MQYAFYFITISMYSLRLNTLFLFMLLIQLIYETEIDNKSCFINYYINLLF